MPIGMSQEEVWALIQAHEAILRSEMRKYVPKQRRTKQELDTIYSDVVLNRAHDIMRLFDSDFGVQPITYLCANIRWYTVKLMHGKCYTPIPIPMTDALEDRSGLNGHEPVADNSVLELGLRVSSLLEMLPKEQAQLLRWHLMEDFTFREIATYLKVSPVEVSKRFSSAMNTARSLLQEDEE